MQVPETVVQHIPRVWQELTSNINPNQDSQYYGVDVYLEVRDFLETMGI